MALYYRFGTVLSGKVSVVKYVLLVAEVVFYLDAFGGVTFLCFDAEG